MDVIQCSGICSYSDGPRRACSALLLNPSAGGSQLALLMSSGVGFQSERK